MSAVDVKDIVLFIIAVFGCLFGIYQFIRKNSDQSKKEVKEETMQTTLLMNELKHIGGNVDEIKTDVKILKAERSKDREDLLVLGENHQHLSEKVNTAFKKIDEIRETAATKADVESLKRDIEDLKH